MRQIKENSEWEDGIKKKKREGYLLEALYLRQKANPTVPTARNGTDSK